ncbi:MAG: lipopolysaccharide heptosyltransferase II [Bauldia sp.]|nr:lipopolysaccharide heptosyltransferase II [Bauldia sp.]
MSGILIVAPAWVGDMVMAESAIRHAAVTHPGARIDVLAPGATAPLAERMEHASRVWTMPAEHGKLGLGMRWRMARQLAGEGYELAIVLPGSWKSALIPMLAGIKRRRGYDREFRHGLLNEKRPVPPKLSTRTVDYYVALADDDPAARPAAKAPELRADLDRGREVAARLGVGQSGKKVLALCPGAEFGPAKQWPARHFAALAAAAEERGHEVWIVGSPKDAPAGDAIVAIGATLGAAPIDLTGKTKLLEAVDLLALADAVVSNDSGLMHVAGALGRPVVAIYGSTSPDVTPPLGPRSAVAEIELPCRPCFQRVCPLGHTNCLNLLTPALVEEKLFQSA